MKAKPIWARLITTLGILALFLGITASPANAFSSVVKTAPTVAHPASSGSVCNTSGESGSETSNLLPINRWSDASSEMLTVLLSQDHIQNMSDRASRNTLVGSFMSFGNTMFKSATEFVTFSSNFCFLDKAGGAIDNIVGSLGKTIFKSEVMTFVILALFVYVIWVSRRTGSFDFKTFGTKIAVMSLVLFMSFQSALSTGGGADKGGDIGNKDANYQPAIGGFGWVMVTANNTLGAIISSPAGLFEKGINGDKNIFDNDPVGERNTNPLSCSMYVEGMRDEYVSTYPQNVYGLNAGMPLMLDSMWQEMGLRAYRTASFGYNLPNPEAPKNAYDDQAWCRLLEWNSGIPGTVGYDKATDVNGDTSGMSGDGGRVPRLSGDLENGVSQRHALREAGLGDNLPTAPGIGTGQGDGVVGKSPGDELWPYTWQGNAFNPGSDVEKQRSLIAWSACNLKDGERAGEGNSWEIRGDFQQIFPPDKRYGEECAKWFRGYDDPGNSPWAGDGRQDAKKFEFPTTKGEVDEKVAKAGGNPALAKYVATINGNDNQQSMASSIVYVFSAGVLSVVFFIFGAITLCAKIFLALLIFGLFAGLLMLCFPKSLPTVVGKVGKIAVSVILLTSMVGFLFSLITLLTRMMQSAGNMFLMQGSIMHLLWMGLSPVVAIVGLHFVFKVANIPSPFTFKGMAQWATAGGAGVIGGAVGSGLTQMRQSGRNMLSRADRRSIGARSRKTSPIQRLSNRASQHNAPGQVGADGVNRRKFAKKTEPAMAGGQSGASKGHGPTDNPGAPGLDGGSTAQEPVAFRKAGRAGVPGGEVEIERPMGNRFSTGEKFARRETRNMRHQDCLDRGHAIEHALNSPNLPRKDRRLLEEQQRSDRSVDDKFRDASVRAYSGAHQVFGAVRSKESWKNGAKSAGRGIWQGTQATGRGIKRGVTSEKFKRMAHDPAGAMASGTVALGKVAKTTAKYGALGVGLTMASALTGGVAAPILIGGAVAGMNAGRIARGSSRVARAGANAVRQRKQRVERRQGAVNRSLAGFRTPELSQARVEAKPQSDPIRQVKKPRVISPKAQETQVRKQRTIEVRNADRTRQQEQRNRDRLMSQRAREKEQWHRTNRQPSQIGSIRGAHWKPRP